MMHQGDDQLKSFFEFCSTQGSKNDHNITETRSDQYNDESRHSGTFNKQVILNKQTTSRATKDIKTFFKVNKGNQESSLFTNLSKKQQSNNNQTFIRPEKIVLEKLDSDQTMSQGCNFINSWVTASRRRSASVTPQPPTAKPTTSENNNGRRASSSDDLVIPSEELGASISNETVCPRLHVDINDCQSHPISLADVLQIDLDKLQLEDEIKNLENQVEYWEHRVDDLERKRFGDDVPRTLVENVLKQRKRIRELDFQIYKLDLETEEYERQSRKFSPSSNEAMSNPLTPQSYDSNSHYPMQEHDSRVKMLDFVESPTNGLIASRFGSHIRPGQENTSDILEAIPPSGSLQHKQYMNKASTVTDSSEYTKMPTYNQHKHQLTRNLGTSASSDDSVHTSNSNDSNLRVSTTRQQQQQLRHHSRYIEQQQVYVQLGCASDRRLPGDRVPNNRHRASPIRPNHFNDDFSSPNLIIDSQDSSSTTSSGSPQCPIRKLFR